MIYKMIKPEIVRDLILYFVQFISPAVRKEVFKQPKISQTPEYKELLAEINAISDEKVIPELDSFIGSINERCLSDRVKKLKEHFLFVGYGRVNVSLSRGETYIGDQFKITVATSYHVRNYDM